MALPFLVIDDSALDCLIVKKVIGFSGRGSDVIVFNDVIGALEYIKNTPIDQLPLLTVITLDIMMPVMDGFDFLDNFLLLPAERQQRFKIFVLSLSNSPFTLKRLADYEVVATVIEKPITIDKLDRALLETI
ncbi:response regulator [Parapedobacter lycopersici]|uniref:response regulator n=1 Tax=Parapedobacter lycopersici TaxID=1864939 RepID=UPI00214DE6CC|nr:response regulator [Parapedobacter lycopersici]